MKIMTLIEESYNDIVKTYGVEGSNNMKDTELYKKLARRTEARVSNLDTAIIIKLCQGVIDELLKAVRGFTIDRATALTLFSVAVCGDIVDFIERLRSRPLEV